VSIREHTRAYVSIREHTKHRSTASGVGGAGAGAAYVSILSTEVSSRLGILSTEVRSRVRGSSSGTQFTCFTGTNVRALPVQILTQETSLQGVAACKEHVCCCPQRGVQCTCFTQFACCTCALLVSGACLLLPATRCAVYLFYSVCLLYLCFTSVRSMPAAARNEVRSVLVLLVLYYCFTSTKGQILTQKTSQTGGGSCGLLASSRSRMLTYADVC
jgi:hypothetical protein